jgi:hypothetical protein
MSLRKYLLKQEFTTEELILHFWIQTMKLSLWVSFGGSGFLIEELLYS